VLVLILLVLVLPAAAQPPKKIDLGPLDVTPKPIVGDLAVKYDYDIVYVRTPRDVNKKMMFTEANHPVHMDPGGDLMLLRPDGSEEALVRGGEGSVTDPFVSFDGQWVYYALFHKISHLRADSADIYKIHVPSRRIVRLTHQEYTPNTGMSGDLKTHPLGIFNLGPCPLPGGRVMFVSSRNGLIPPKFYTASPLLQLFTMDEDGQNVELIGHLNIGGALHPVPLKDGRVMFSSFESQGLRGLGLWGLWSIHPDGTNWGPLLSAFNGGSVDQITHFQTQLSDGHIVLEEYYNQNNWAFGSYYKFPVEVPDGVPRFGPAYRADPRNPPLRVGRHPESRDGGLYNHLPFSPYGLTVLTPFTHPFDRPAPPSALGDSKSPPVGKFTHPSAAPDNHLLTVWSPGPVNHNGHHPPVVDAGIYLIKQGRPIEAPGEMLLIKNDPKYNEQWPRALAPYRRIYGVAEPRRLPPLANDGRMSPHLPEGTPYGLVGTSSLYKRESYPNGKVFPGEVTARYADDGYDRLGYEGLGAFNPQDEYGTPLSHWGQQGAEAGRYSNSDIHAIRIVVMEAATARRERPRFFSFAQEQMRILGEIPVRKYPLSSSQSATSERKDAQPLDPDGNPDTSFLAKIPADTPFTFQTLDKDGMLLNASQTWHQVRPGEIRNDCGGCHAHSQKPTAFRDTAAARPDYKVFDLTKGAVLLTDKARDESGRQWDVEGATGLRRDSAAVKNVEFYRDVKPIFDRSCIACHTQKWQQPAGNLVLDDEAIVSGSVPYRGSAAVSGTYNRLVMDSQAKYGHKPLISSWRGEPTRYIRMFQSRRSLLVWKVHGRRTDGWSNDDFPTEQVPGDARTLQHKGKPIADTPENRMRGDLDYVGAAMPPPEAVAGTYSSPDGQQIKVPPLSDEDRRTIVRWIDLGCPIDLDFDPKNPAQRGSGWMADDLRPTLTVTSPRAGINEPLTRLLVGMHDSYTGLNTSSFRVVADFEVNGTAAGDNLSPQFKLTMQGVWELKLTKPIMALPRARLTVSVEDKQGNVTRIDRTFSVAAGGAAPRPPAN
jgi:hypothetical protein